MTPVQSLLNRHERIYKPPEQLSVQFRHTTPVAVQSPFQLSPLVGLTPVSCEYDWRRWLPDEYLRSVRSCDRTFCDSRNKDLPSPLYLRPNGQPSDVKIFPKNTHTPSHTKIPGYVRISVVDEIKQNVESPGKTLHSIP